MQSASFSHHKETHMFDREAAENFARAWVSAWNDRDLDAILAQYADNIVFHSPRIRQVLGKESPSLTGKTALRDYWTHAMDKAGDLFFEIDRILISSDALTLLYTNRRSQNVAETFMFNAEGLVRESVTAYD